MSRFQRSKASPSSALVVQSGAIAGIGRMVVSAGSSGYGSGNASSNGQVSSYPLNFALQVNNSGGQAADAASKVDDSVGRRLLFRNPDGRIRMAAYEAYPTHSTNQYPCPIFAGAICLFVKNTTSSVISRTVSGSCSGAYPQMQLQMFTPNSPVKGGVTAVSQTNISSPGGGVSNGSGTANFPSGYTVALVLSGVCNPLSQPSSWYLYNSSSQLRGMYGFMDLSIDLSFLHTGLEIDHEMTSNAMTRHFSVEHQLWN